MTAVPHTAFLLAAGLGTRMRPLTDDRPKPMVELSGRPMIDHFLDAVVDVGVQRAVVNVHWCADMLEAHLAGRTDIEIVVSDERAELLETGGGIAKARGLLGDDPIFVVNTDALWAPADGAPLRALADAYDPDRMDELLLLADIGRSLGFRSPGDFFRADDGVLTHRGDADRASWAFAGTRIMDPKAYDSQPIEKFSAFRIWKPMLAAGRLHGLPLDAFWLHIGDPQALRDANMWLGCHGF
ncbi:MAG: nucleotidyltransferase family protein [Pseudomonadota bacterium]